MFITPDFVEKYYKRAHEIKIDNMELSLFPEKQCAAISAYLYDMYMKVRKHVPCEELFEEESNL